ncbi:ComEC/Rec2 family competence protein [Roseibium sp.]|uniref:ComEC/Rec2 family competence protein n=1 Tax=Roseibium sp. TaxID=1936156 RepID=UPI003BAFD386
MSATGSDPQIDYKTRSKAEASSDTQRKIEAARRPFGHVVDRGRKGWLFGHSVRVKSRVTTFDQFWDEQGLLWVAFSFASGIAGYFLLPSEPSRIAVLLVGLCTFLIALRVRRRQALAWYSVLLLAFSAGLGTASLRSSLVDAPRLAMPMTVEVGGIVLERQFGPKHDRLVLSVETVKRRAIDADAFPHRLRLRVPKESGGQVGERVRLKGRLFPPPGPVHPGGYDFSFRAYFMQIGATGFSFGPAEMLGPAESGLKLRGAAMVAKLRGDLANRIRTDLGDRPETALVVALLVGDRSGISEQQEEALRASGLAHILAISGLHMALFAGGTYGGVLLLLALLPALSLRWPTHKWAAVAALLAATFYLLLSGASVATQRSYLMIALVFLGLLAGRRGLTLRSVALAALVLLALAPERLFFPGFQMSFAAVICLVAVYELWRRREADFQGMTRDQGLRARIVRSVGAWGAGLFVTALVAGLATGIIGAHHFGRVAPYGLVGNMLGMPVFTLLVMPMGVLALVLMPFGLAVLPLTVMSFGISILLDVAEFTSALDAGQGAVGKLDAVAAVLLLGSLFTGLLLPGRLRLVAVLLFAGGVGSAVQARPPDLQIATTGASLAARDEEGNLRYSGRRSSFATELWFQAEGIPSQALGSRRMIASQRRCDAQGCVFSAFGNEQASEAATGKTTPVFLAVPKTLEALVDDCRYADIVVSDFIVPENCGADLVIDQVVRTRRGAVAIWLSSQKSRGPALEATARSLDNETETENGRTTIIERLVHAIPDPPRPWHLPGTVTYGSLRRSEGNKTR